MARYKGPKSKISRKFGEPIYGGFDKALEKKKYRPGQHGNSRKRRQPSEYAIQLAEKQKAKYTYGVLERQFANLYEKASRRTGVTGEILLQLLESRLDNVVYRLGVAPSRPAARQLVSHKHITVNGKVTNIPSYTLRPGDVVGVRERSKSLHVITDSLGELGTMHGWLNWDAKGMTGTFVEVPERENIPENIKEQLIIELYSK
jgi:small subunit ribosomal protein S4